MAKQWYDFERSAYHFVRVARELKAPIVCKRVSDFDKNGIFYWIGSNARSVNGDVLVQLTPQCTCTCGVKQSDLSVSANFFLNVL